MSSIDYERHRRQGT